MCGILFAYEKDQTEDFQSRGKRALAAMKHRGPDSQNLIYDNAWQIGQTRLSIIDIVNSKQPMSTDDGRYVISFNGEIYNYKELRHELEPQWVFRSNGDTEVLLAGLTLYGTKYIEKLDGMWAFVFWDKKQHKVIASRDRFGKKPIYYHATSSQIYIASELSALQILVPVKLTQNSKSVTFFLKYGVVPPGSTIYSEICEVKPAHTMIWNLGASAVHSRYWRLPTRRNRSCGPETHERIRELLLKSVRKRLIADVEVGSFLSGGIDSSIITYLASNEYHGTLKTFNIKFSDSGFDESYYARLVAAHLNTDHHEYTVDKLSPDHLSALIQNNIGQPFGDPSLLPTAHLCQTAAAELKVALSGDGADEVFSGYQRYQAKVLLSWYKHLPMTVREHLSKVVALIPDSYSHHSKSLAKKVKLFSNLAASQEFNNNYIAPIIISDDILIDLLSDYNLPNKPACDQIKSLEEVMYQDMVFYLPQDILTKVDRASMAYSLEVRSPFLDKDLVEFIFQLDIKCLRGVFSGKKILRDAYKNKLPSPIFNRKKQGFSSPIYSWFLSATGDEMLDLAGILVSPINKDILEKLLSQHRSGKLDLSLQLWNIYSYLKWLEGKK